MAKIGPTYTTGLGRGSAQVFNTQGIVNAYANRARQEQEQRAADDKYYGGLLAKVNPEGLRDVDLVKFSDYKNKIIDAYGRMKKSTSPDERTQASIDFNNALQEATGFIAKGKNATKLLTDTTDKFYKVDSWQRPDDHKDTENYLRYTSVDDPSYSETIGKLNLNIRDKEADLDKIVDETALQSSVNYADKDWTKDKFGILKKSKGTKLEYEPFLNNFAQRIARDKQLEYTVDRYYQQPFRTRSNEEKSQEVEVANQLGIKNYDPNSYEHYVALKAYAPLAKSSKYNKDDTEYKTERKGQAINVYSGQQNQYADAVGSGRKEIYTTTYDTQGNAAPVITTVEDSYTFPDIKGSITGGPNIRSLESGDKITDPIGIRFEGSETLLAPVYKKGTKAASTGKDLSDVIVPDEKIEQEKNKGVVEYKTLFRFQDEDGNPYYMPAKDVLANVQLLKSGKDDAGQIAKMTEKLEAKRAKLNANLPKASKKTESKKDQTITLEVNGKLYHIPQSQVKEFKKDFPNAKQRS